MKRGDGVLADFPFQDVPGSKVRPAVVVQNDADNQALANTILAMITGNLADAGRATNVLVDPATADGAGSGLHGPSLIKCGNPATVRQQRILRVIAHLTGAVQQQVNRAVKQLWNCLESRCGTFSRSCHRVRPKVSKERGTVGRPCHNKASTIFRPYSRLRSKHCHDPSRAPAPSADAGAHHG